MRSVFILFFSLISTPLFSVVYTSSQDGNWNNAATWGGGGTPGVGDDAIISGGFRVIANQTVTVNTITIGSATSNDNELQGVGGRTLTVTGTITINPATAGGAGINWLDVRDGTMSCAAITSGLTGADNIDCAVDIRDGYLTVAGDLTMDPTSARSDINFTNTGNGTLDVGGDIITGTLRMRTVSGDVGSRIINANSLTVGTTITVNHSGVGDITGPARIDCPWILTNNRTVNVTGDGNDATEDLVISGVISDGGGDYRLIKSGDGSLTLSAANTFTDDVRLDAGKLNINNAQALGLGNSADPLDIRGGIIDNTSGGPITIARAVGSMSYTISSDFTFAGSNELNFNTGAVDFTTDVTITCEGLSKLVIGGVINEPGQNVVKAGTGELEFGASTTLLNNLTQTGGDLVFGASNLTLNDLTITSGNFTPPTSGVLFLGGDFTNDGTLISVAGTVEFTSTGTQVVSGSSSTTIFNVENSGGGIVQLDRDLDVSNTLTMTSGDFNLNSNTLTLGVSAVSTGTLVHAKTLASGIVYDGTFNRFVNAAALTSGGLHGFFPFGTNGGKYRPLEVTSAAGPSTGGVISVSHQEANNKNATTDVAVVDGGSTITKRNNTTWTVSSSGVVGGTYELNIGGTGFGTITSIADLRLMQSGSVSGTAGANAGSTAQPQVLRTGLALADISNSHHIGSVNDTDSPLPVELISFSANYSNGKVELFWTTLSEVNNDYFIVLRSTNGHDFREIVTVKGKGNYIGRTNYHFQDFSETHSELVYYRLKQVDFDGSNSLSKVLLQVNVERKQDVNQLVNCNNLVNTGGDLKIVTTNQDIIITGVHLYSMSGKLVYSKRYLNTNRMVVNMRSLPSTLYICKIFLEGGQVLVKKVALR